jgi:hypothetical protein
MNDVNVFVGASRRFALAGHKIIQDENNASAKGAFLL